MFDGGSRQRELDALRFELDRLRRFAEALEGRLAQQDAGVRGELDQLRGFVEARAQTQENLVRAMLREADGRVAEALEPRIELAAREAIAFAEHALMQQQAALRTLGRRVAEIARERTAAPPAVWIAPTTPAAAAYLIGAPLPQAASARRLEIRDEPEALFLADLADLPIPPGGATRLTVAHVVEFVAAAALEQTLLPHWRERLAPGGELVVVTLDGPPWTAALAREAADFERLRARLAAQGRRPVRTLFDRQSLASLLTKAGLAVVETESDRSEAVLEVVARAPT